MSKIIKKRKNPANHNNEMYKDRKVEDIKERYIVPILGISLDSTHRDTVLKRVKYWLNQAQLNNQKILIVTPNPEIIIRAQNDSVLKKALNSADLALPDGIGSVIAQKFVLLTSPSIPIIRELLLIIQGLWIGLSAVFSTSLRNHVVPGRVVFERIMRLAKKQGWKIFLLGAEDRIAANLARTYQRRGINVVGTSGFRVMTDGRVDRFDAKKEKETITKINSFKPDVLFIAFGAPKQEKWLYKNLDKLKCRVAMTVGGTFDYYSGRRALPPHIFEKLGFEWLWRFITQPWRAKRIFTAAVVFPVRVYLYKIKQ